MADLLDLANEMDALANKLSVFANATGQDAASTVLNDLTQVTPIDTGTAVSNWIVTLDSPALSGLILAPFVPSPKGRVKHGVWVHAVDPAITAQANVPQTFQAGLAVIKSKKQGQSIFITNNAPYIELLNQGSSSQAPAGFVDRAIILGEQSVKRVVFP